MRPGQSNTHAHPTLFFAPHHSHHCLSSIINVSPRLSPVTLKKDSQDEGFHSNQAPRRKGKQLVVTGNPVHIYVLFGILSVVQPCVLVQSPCVSSSVTNVLMCIVSNSYAKAGCEGPLASSDHSLQGCENEDCSDFPTDPQSPGDSASKTQRNVVCSGSTDLNLLF